MRSFEARDLLLAMASALRKRPPSFTFQFTSTVTAADAEGKGGTSVQPASGVPSTAAADKIEVTQKALDAELRDKVLKAAHDIDFIAGEITRDKPDRALIERLVEGIPEEVVGSVVPTLVSAILAACS
jgi:hypothetical protein